MAQNHPSRGDLMLAAARAFQQTHWQPAVDIYQISDGWLLKFELAGVSPHEVELAVHGRQVIVRGRRRDMWIAERQQSFSMEISYNQFERTVELPCELDTMTMATDYRDGMLLVRLTCETPGT